MSEAATTYSAEHIDQLLRCPVCLDRLNNPKLLPCQHTFCASPCLERLVEEVLPVLRCPECRTEHYVPYEGIQGFPINRTIQSFLDLQSQGGASSATTNIPEGSCHICEQSGDGDIAKCIHCNKQSCASCRRSHREQMRHDVGKMVNQIRRSLPKISGAITDVEQKTTQLQQNCESIKSEISSNIERAIKELRDREKMLHNEANTIIQGELRSLRLHQENYEVELASVSSYCDSTESSFSRDQGVTDQDLMSFKRQCFEHMERLRNFHGDNQVSSPQEIRFTVEPQMLLSSITSFGELVVLSNEMTNSNLDPRMHLSLREMMHLNMPLPSQPHMQFSPHGQGIPTYSTTFNPGSYTDALRPPEAFMINFSNSETADSPVNHMLSVNRNHSDSREDFQNSQSPRVGNENPSPRNSQSLTNNRQSTNQSGSGNNQSDESPQNPSSQRSSDSSASHLNNFNQPTVGHRGQTFVRGGNSDGPSVRRPNVAGQGISFEIPGEGTADAEFNIDEEIESLTNSQNSDATVQFRYSMGDSVVLQHARNNYHLKGRMLHKIGRRGSESGRFTWPRGISVSPINDSIVVADSSNHRVQLFDCHRRFLRSFGSYGQGSGEFDCLAGIAVNHMGQIVIADRYNHRIQIFDRYGDFMLQFGEEGNSEGQLSYPWGVACDNMGFIYVCDKDNHRIQVFQLDGTFVRKFGSLGSQNGQFENPHYITVSTDHRVVVSDSSNHRIQVFDTYGHHQLSFGQIGIRSGHLKYPRGVAVDDQGFIIVADSGNNRVQVFRSNGRFHSTFGSWGSGDGQLKGLEGIALTSSGNIVVSDRENHRIQMF